MSVIIPSRNVADCIHHQLHALAQQRFGGSWEVVVVDNQSTDDTRQAARAFTDRLPSIRVVDAFRRPGLNYTRNVGAAAAEGDVLLYCDADDVVGSGWVSALVESLGRADAAGGALRYVYPGPPGHEPRSRVTEGLAGGHLRFLPFAPGGNCGIRTEVFHQLGGFREDSRGSDAEFFWRLQLAGFSLVFQPEAVITYVQRTAIRDVARAYFGYGVEDALLYRDFRGEGMPRDGLGRAAKAYAALAVRAPRLLSSWEGRRALARAAARRAGRVRGSVAARTLFL